MDVATRLDDRDHRGTGILGEGTVGYIVVKLVLQRRMVRSSQSWVVC